MIRLLLILLLSTPAFAETVATKGDIRLTDEDCALKEARAILPYRATRDGTEGCYLLQDNRVLLYFKDRLEVESLLAFKLGREV